MTAAKSQPGVVLKNREKKKINKKNPAERMQIHRLIDVWQTGTG
jgi:hypothetical protein